MTGYTASFEPAMRLALEEAALAAANPGDPDVPVGAVVLDPSGAVVARARNRREADGDPTAHAEILALREAARVAARGAAREASRVAAREASRGAGSWRLTGYTLVVTLEPCAMCAGAVTAARVGRLVFGADDPNAGAVGSLYDVVRDPRLGHQPEVIRGVLADAAGDLLKVFFAARRAEAEPS